MSHADREKWDRLHAEAGDGGSAPRWLSDFDALLPRHGRALDVASGTGRLALWAAARGLDVLAVDVSPVALARIAHPRVRTYTQDLELNPQVPPGPFALITLFHYRQPSLQEPIQAALAPGGYLVAELATVQNLERHARPSRRWLAAPGELQRFASGLTLVHYEEGWLHDRHTARLVARRD